MTLQSISYRTGTDEFRGWSDLPGSVWLLIKAELVAIVAVIVVSIPLFPGLYALFILAEFFLGSFLGLGLAHLFRSLRVRQTIVAFPICIIAAATGLILLQGTQYLHDIDRLYRATLLRTPQLRSKMNTVQALFRFHNTFLRRKTGYGGLLGNLLLHMQNSSYSDIQFVQAIVTFWTVWAVVKRQIAEPFCSSCGNWMRKPINAAVVHVNLGKSLVQAIRERDVSMALEITRKAAGVPLGNGCVIARLYRCATCEEKMVDVVERRWAVVVSRVHSRGATKQRNSVILQPLMVNSEFVAALRSDPVEAVDEDIEEAGQEFDQANPQ